MLTNTDATLPEPDETPAAQPKKIAIVGRAPSSQKLAPYADESWEIWGLSSACFESPRWTRWFEIHEIEPRKEKWGPYWKWLQEAHGKPKYLRELHPEVPDGVLFPRREVQAELAAICEGNGGDSYFTNSVSWMLALAIHEGANEIGVYGVDMAQQGEGLASEYAHQRPSVEFFIGLALGRGIKVTVPDTCDLLKNNLLYGFDSGTNKMRVKHAARHKELKTRLSKAQQAMQERQAECLVLQGALDDMTWWKQWEE